MSIAGIWNQKTFSDVATYTARKEIDSAVGESYMSFTTTNLIGAVASSVGTEPLLARSLECRQFAFYEEDLD